jgi:hypothetical protein
MKKSVENSTTKKPICVIYKWNAGNLCGFASKNLRNLPERKGTEERYFIKVYELNGEKRIHQVN